LKIHTVSSKPLPTERELTVNIALNENEEWTAYIYTNIHKYHNRCIKQGWKQTSETLHIDGTWVASTFEAPAKAITIGKANKPKRQMTDEQRIAAAERMAKWRETKDNNIERD
jgi:hypothetical protein